MAELERQFRESEETRKKTLEKVEVAKSGEALPGSAKQILTEIGQLKKIFSSETASELWQAQAFRRVSRLFDVIQTRVEALEELKEFSMEIDGLTNVLNTIKSGIEGAHNILVGLDRQLTAEFEERRKHRQLAQTTLSKLNKYLDNWL